MARTKEFDESEVLDRALALFQARGFKGTSFTELTDELGVCRQSLYDTYGDKHELFMAALRRYTERTAECVKRAMADPAPVREVFGAMFDRTIAPMCTNGAPGCFLTNTMVELAPDQEAARALALSHARTIEGLFASRLAAAQRQGEISRDKDPLALARFIYHMLLGLSVAARALDTGDTLRQSARLSLRVLD